MPRQVGAFVAEKTRRVHSTLAHTWTLHRINILSDGAHPAFSCHGIRAGTCLRARITSRVRGREAYVVPTFEKCRINGADIIDATSLSPPFA